MREESDKVAPKRTQVLLLALLIFGGWAVWAIPRDVQGFLLALHIGITPGDAPGTIGARD